MKSFNENLERIIAMYHHKYNACEYELRRFQNKHNYPVADGYMNEHIAKGVTEREVARIRFILKRQRTLHRLIREHTDQLMGR